MQSGTSGNSSILCEHENYDSITQSNMTVIAVSVLALSCAGSSRLSAEEEALLEGMPLLGAIPMHIRGDLVGAAMEQECGWHWLKMRTEGL